MKTLEWFTHLECINGRQEVAKMFAIGVWKVDFKDNAPVFVCYSERECKLCPNCSKDKCLCSIESTENINYLVYHEQLKRYCLEFSEFC